MAKQAIIVTFEARIRLIVDLPYGEKLGDRIAENPDVLSIITYAARRKMELNGINNYLCEDNMDWSYDEEMPVNDDTPSDLEI